MKPRDIEETAVSAAGQVAASEPTERADAAGGTSGPTDMTVVRSTPSGATVNDLANPGHFGKYELLG